MEHEGKEGKEEKEDVIAYGKGMGDRKTGDE